MSIVDLAMNLTGWIEALMFFMLFDAFMERRFPFSLWHYGLSIFLLGSLIWFINHYCLYTLINSIAMIGAALLVSSFLYKGLFQKRFLAAILGMAIIDIMEMSVLYAIALVFEITIETILTSSVHMLLGIITSKTLGLMVCDAIRVKSNIRDFKLGKIYWLLFVVLFSSVILVVFILFWMTYKLNDFTYNTMAGICSFVLIFCSFFCAIFIRTFCPPKPRASTQSTV